MASDTPLENFLDDGSDGPRELAGDIIEFLDEPDEAWPTWAQNILAMLKCHGYEYEPDDEIMLPDDVSEFIEHQIDPLAKTQLDEWHNKHFFMR